jgi:hypothetical protein
MNKFIFTLLAFLLLASCATQKVYTKDKTYISYRHEKTLNLILKAIQHTKKMFAKYGTDVSRYDLKIEVKSMIQIKKKLNRKVPEGKFAPGMFDGKIVWVIPYNEALRIKANKFGIKLKPEMLYTALVSHEITHSHLTYMGERDAGIQERNCAIHEISYYDKKSQEKVLKYAEKHFETDYNFAYENYLKDAHKFQALAFKMYVEGSK